MRRKIFFLDWDTNGPAIIQDVAFSVLAQHHIQMFVFYAKSEIPSKLLPQFRFLHLPRIAVVKSFDSTDWRTIAGDLARKNRRCSIPEKKDVFIVSTKPDVKFGELIELLKAAGVDFKLVDSTESGAILERFHVKCTSCKLIFQNRSELNSHDQKFCGYFDRCLTKKDKRKVGFSESSEFQDEDPKSHKCETCLENCIFTYCPKTSRTKNMKEAHRTRFVGKTHASWSTHDTADFSAHFLFGYDTLPCLAGHGCPRSFGTVQDQAHHHVTEHGSSKPYFCMVCYKILKIQCFETEGELLFHGKLEGHCEPDFAFPWLANSVKQARYFFL